MKTTICNAVIISYATFNFNLLFSVTIRLKSIKNIQKITKSMKMVAAAKYARAEKSLKPARVYGTGAMGMLNQINHIRCFL